MEAKTIRIEGMSCGACVARVRRVLERVPGLGVEEIQVGWARVAGQAEALERARVALCEAGWRLSAERP